MPMSESIATLKHVGPRLVERLERLGIRTVADLFFHLPLRYEDRTRLTPIGALRPGQEALVEGVVEHAEVVYRGRRMLVALVADGTGALLLRLFHFGKPQIETFSRGTRLRLYGEARRGAAGLEMAHPEYRVLDGDDPAPVDAALTPVYPVTEGLGQQTLRRLTSEALAQTDMLPELIPPELLEGSRLPPHILRAADPPSPVGAPEGAIRPSPGEESRLPSLAEALACVHRPPPDADLALLREGHHPAQQRLALEELVAHHLSLARLRVRTAREPAPPIAVEGRLYEALARSLPFALTGAQRRVIGEIAADLRRPHPMLRLVQGDVGSGKTLVAVAACLHAVEAGHQAAVMAPTEILADQHARNFRAALEPLGVNVAWLAGKTGAKEKRAALAAITDGTAQVAVGTHALFQDEVAFHDLALVVIDEQHRFGVHQRLALREKGAGWGRVPHQLIMTATPIPRTLAMTAYADLDYSAIDELPPGRKPVTTVALAADRRPEVVEGIHRAVADGRQIYWVCTLIEESEALQCEAAANTCEALAAALPELRVALVHGRMKPREKEAVMTRFKDGEVDLLVATTVIEVGVDVPNATLMVVENAERLGLAQLHQLRGRVGRGAQESSCVLLYQPPLTDTARKRIDAMRTTSDGFEIARIDLELRGPGEVLGTRQTGLMQFRIADLLRDRDLLPHVQRIAARMMSEHPECVDALIARWVSAGLRYGQVG